MVEYIQNLTSERKVHFDYHDAAKFPASSTIMHNGVRCLPARHGHDHGPLHLIATWEETLEDGTKVYRPNSDSAVGTVYQPFEVGTEDVDIMGATYVEDLGTHFRAAHCSPRAQADFAREAQQFTYNELQDVINRELSKVAAATDDATRAAARDSANALINLAQQAGADTHYRVISATLGYFHREPHQDHKRDLAVVSIRTVEADWAEKGQTNPNIALDLQRVRTYTPDILRELEVRYSPETRAAREKRLRDAKAAAGQDPVDGKEYVYTRARTRAEITGDDLPDPTWPFNNFPTAGRVRGDFTYYDSQPAATSFMRFVVRFERPVPTGTQPGADIGSVAWAQGPAYQPS